MKDENRRRLSNEELFEKYKDAGTIAVYEFERILGRLDRNGFKVTKQDSSVLLLCTCFQSLQSKISVVLGMMNDEGLSKETRDNLDESVKNEVHHTFVLLYDLNNTESIQEVNKKPMELMKCLALENLLGSELMELVSTVARI